MPPEQPNRFVLIVDDDPDARALMSLLVRSLDVDVKMAEDGNEAIEIVRQGSPAFVVLDIMMPGMDGFGVLSHLQMNPKTRSVPILIVTGANLQPSDILDLRETVIGVVRKGDLDIEDIKRVISETLKET